MRIRDENSHPDSARCLILRSIEDLHHVLPAVGGARDQPHRFLGGSRNLGLSRLMTTAASMEQDGVTGPFG
jgi:hypothetical protein